MMVLTRVNSLPASNLNSNRDSLLTFIGEELVAVRWHEFRLYPKQFVSSNNEYAGSWRFPPKGNGFPAIFNIEADPREEVNILATHGWVIPVFALDRAIPEITGENPNPKAVNLTEFDK